MVIALGLSATACTTAADVDDVATVDETDSASETEVEGVDPYDAGTIDEFQQFESLADWGQASFVGVVLVTNVESVAPDTLFEDRGNAALRVVTGEIEQVIDGEPGDGVVRFTQLGDEEIEGVLVSGQVPGSIRLEAGDRALVAVGTHGDGLTDPLETYLWTFTSVFLLDGGLIVETDRRQRNPAAPESAASTAPIDEVEGIDLEEFIDLYRGAVENAAG